MCGFQPPYKFIQRILHFLNVSHDGWCLLKSDNDRCQQHQLPPNCCFTANRSIIIRPALQTNAHAFFHNDPERPGVKWQKNQTKILPSHSTTYGFGTQLLYFKEWCEIFLMLNLFTKSPFKEPIELVNGIYYKVSTKND